MLVVLCLCLCRCSCRTLPCIFCFVFCFNLCLCLCCKCYCAYGPRLTGVFYLIQTSEGKVHKNAFLYQGKALETVSEHDRYLKLIELCQSSFEHKYCRPVFGKRHQFYISNTHMFKPSLHHLHPFFTGWFRGTNSQPCIELLLRRDCINTAG